MMGFEGQLRGLRKGLGMTLYGLVRAENHIVVAADGVGTLSDDDVPRGHPAHLQLPAQKLAQIPDTPLLRGLAGRFSDIRRVDNWLVSHPPTSWTTLGEGLGELVADLNAATRQRAHKARQKRDKVELSCLVVAGFLDGELDFMTVGSDGDFVRGSDARQPWLFMGVIGLTAAAAWQTVTALNPHLPVEDPETLRRFMETFCAIVPELGLPIDAWRVSAAGCGQVQPAAANSGEGSPSS